MDMTSGGFPSAPTRLTTLPLHSKYIFLPCISKQSKYGLIGYLLSDSIYNFFTSISLSKCPAFASKTPFFILLKCCAVTTFLCPVHDINISALVTTWFICFTLYPSIYASIALMGSTSTIVTLAPNPLALEATPCPTNPYPHTTTCLPAIRTLVNLIIPYKVLCPVPYLLSNKCLVFALLTPIIGYINFASFSNAFNRVTPDVVSSVPPITPRIFLL